MNEKHKNSEQAINIWPIVIVIIAGFFLRILNITDRPYHHDESLHAIYGLYYYLDHYNGFYKYLPLIHGPLLYNIEPYFYHLFGVNELTPRLIPFFIGTIIMLIPIIFRRYLSRSILLIATTYFALSPSLIYWSRFIRHDHFIILFTILIFWGICVAKDKYKTYFILIPAILQFTAKENAYVHLAIITGFILFEWFLVKIKVVDAVTTIKKINLYIKSYPWHVLASFAIGALLYCYFYSAGFQYSQGILDGLYRKSLAYWFEQHASERIKGPFLFPSLIIFIYDTLFVFTFIYLTTSFYIKEGRTYLKYQAYGTILSAIIYVIAKFYGVKIPIINSIWTLGKLDLPVDIFFFILIPVFTVTTTIFHLREKNRVLATWGFLFGATLFTYSYLGEKVPWLATYPLLSGIIYLMLKLKETKYHIQITIALALYLIPQAVLTNYTLAGSDKELLSQVHTTKIFETLILDIRKQLNSPLHNDQDKIAIKGAAIWPSTWYLHGNEKFHFNFDKSNVSDFTYVIFDPEDSEITTKLQLTHTMKRLPLRSWFVPNYSTITPYTLARYIIWRIPWNETGSQQIMFAKKNNEAK